MSGAIEQLFAELVSQGHKIAVEYDSAARRANSEDAMYLGILEAGKQLSINGVDTENAQAYWRWKREQSLR